MSEDLYQQSIDIMGQTLYNQLITHADNNDIENAHAIYSEWIVDGLDPEDDSLSYEFTFLPLISL